MPAHVNSGSFKKGHNMKGENHPNFLPIFTERIRKCGGNHRKPHFRIFIKIGPSHRDWILKSRFIIEQTIKRKLLPIEQIHHINENSLDDRIENYSLLSHVGHRHNHKIQTWSRKFPSCKRCGTIKKKHMGRGLCSSCIMRERFELLGYWP